MVKFIAEVCQNHNGDEFTLWEQVQEASNAGFTHVKIQGLYSHELVFREEFENVDSLAYRPFDKEKERLKKLDLDEETEAQFLEKCHDSGVIPMITVFTHAGLERAKRIGFSSIKIASYDCASFPLIEGLFDWAKEITVSTGATEWQLVLQTKQILDRAAERGISTALLHARTIYPMPLEMAGLSRMISLKSLGHEVGWSDHSDTLSQPLIASKLAIALGANIVERHFTVLPKGETKDGRVSLDPLEARELVEFSQLSKQDQLKELSNQGYLILDMIGDGSLEPTVEEVRNSRYYRGRVASRNNDDVVFSWERLNSLDERKRKE